MPKIGVGLGSGIQPGLALSAAPSILNLLQTFKGTVPLKPPGPPESGVEDSLVDLRPVSVCRSVTVFSLLPVLLGTYKGSRNLTNDKMRTSAASLSCTWDWDKHFAYFFLVSSL